MCVDPQATLAEIDREIEISDAEGGASPERRASAPPLPPPHPYLRPTSTRLIRSDAQPCCEHLTCRPLVFAGAEVFDAPDDARQLLVLVRGRDTHSRPSPRARAATTPPLAGLCALLS